MASPLPVASRTRARTKKGESSSLPIASRTRARTTKGESFSESLSSTKPEKRKGGSLGVKRAACDVLFCGFGTSGVRTKGGGRGAGQRASSVSGDLGEDSISDDSREVIVITGSEDDSDEVILVSGSGEEEEESCDYGPQTSQRFEFLDRFGNAVIVDENERTNVESDESEGSHENGTFGGDEFLSSACCDDDLIRSGQAKVFAKQGERNGRSFKPKNDDYARNVSGNRTPSITKDDPEAHLSFNYVSSSSESLTEADESGDEDFIAKVSESLSTEGETSQSSEEYVSGSEHEENLDIRKKRKCEGRGELSSLYSETKTTREIHIECTDDRVIDFAGKKEDVECRFLWVDEWLHDDVEQEKVEEATNVELDIECMDDLVIDDAERKNNMECRISWVNEWLQGDVEKVKEEERMNVEQLNAEISCPPNDENGNSGQMEARGIPNVSEHGGVKEKVETECRSKEGGGGLQAADDEHGNKGKAWIEFNGVNAGTDASFVDGGGEIEEMEVVRIKQEKRCDKHVHLDSDSSVGYATSLKEAGQKKRDSGMSCSMQQLKEKRKYEDYCSSEKVFASRNARKELESDTNGAVEEKRTVISKLGKHATGLGSSAEPMMQMRKASETLSKLCKEANNNAAKARKKDSSVGRRCQSNEKTVRSDCKDNGESRTRRERAGESRTDTLFKLASCIWGKHEILQDDVQKENAEREKPLAGHCAEKEERKESTEGSENFGMAANSIKRDCLDEMYERKKVEECRNDRRSTRDYHIRWERSIRSKEFKYFKRLCQKYNKDDAGQEEIVWEILRRTELQPEVPSLPLKFFWGDKEPEPASKSEAEKEMDKMWSDMEFSLKAGEVGSSEPPKETETTRATLCSGGKYELICDEEIGLICLFCDQIVHEMKYVLPPFLPSFEKFSVEVSSTKTLPKGGNLSFFEGNCLEPSGNDSVGLSRQSSSVLNLIPCDRSKVYPHQLEAFEFMWKNLAGSTDLKELSISEPKNVGGCIISHAPGTGKTCLTILFLHTYLRLFPNSRPMVIAPASMLLTWEEEFRRWNKQWDTSISFHNVNNPEFSGSENLEAVRIMEADRHLKRCSNVMRMIKVYSWSKSSSILGISYNLYEKIAVAKRKGIKNLVKKAELEKKDEEMRKMLLDLPGVVVFDEGHTPRNQRSSIWKLLLKLRTEKRIILSGTPFQNNFLELYNTLCLVRPTTASELPPSLKKFCQTRTTQQKRAKTDDINSLVQPHDKVADEAIVNIRSIMAPFVHVHKGGILKENLPGIKECIVVLNPGEMQKTIVENILRSQCGFEYEFKLSLACIHPSLILSCKAYVNGERVISHERQKLEDLKTSTDAGVKTRFLVELIRLSEALGEKVLIFSQYKEPLSLISDQLRSTFHWSSGKDILHMHGSLDLRERQRLIGEFNNRKSEARVMLASTKACSEGISLVGASRVVLLDVVWNPSVERQAISRAFRIGQEKVVYSYHLIMKGTAECDKFRKQMEKERLSKMVFSPSYKENGDRKKSGMVSEDKILEAMTSSKNFKDMFDHILYQPEDSDLAENIHSETIP